MDVGVRELKQHLSEYLQRAENGETIRVTDRGEPKALLCPLPKAGRLAAGVKEGWVREAEKAPIAPVSRARASLTTADALAEDRDP